MIPSISWDHSAPSRILVIDDNPAVHEAFDGILRSEPANAELEADERMMFGPAAEAKVTKPVYELVHALSGLDGVEKVRQALREDRPYQVAFVDIRMPGMDGVETIERVWQLDAQVQTVICTAYADYRWEELAKRLGPTDRLLVLKKPFHDLEVMQMASTLAQKWFLGKQAAAKFEQMELVVGQRTQQLLEFQRREHQRIHELDQTKLRYLVNLAQEFRSPLTVILNPLEELMQGKVLNRPTQELIYRNARSLAQLVENSLLLRRLEPEDQPLAWEQKDVVAFVRGLVQLFAAGAQQRGVQLEFETEEEQRHIWTDAAKLEKVLFNLFARALESAADKSRLTIQLGLETEQVTLTLETTESLQSGKTLSAAQPFLPEPSPLADTDIALLVTQQTLSVLRGRLTFQPLPCRHGSRPGGVRMVVTFPVSKPELDTSAGSGQSLTAGRAEAPAQENELSLILLVEGNTDLRTFIRQGLESEYRVLETENGEEALALAQENVPDLIVVGSEFLRRDSVNLCAGFKRDKITSHIPIILLMADDSEAGQLQALEVGVDDCLTKPFRLRLLQARVENLLGTRRKLHEHFQQLSTVQPREMASNQMDAEFLRRVVEIVEKNLADYQFDMETLAHQMAVSRRQLFRKFKALAGCTPNVFIRDIRLKRAAQLLRESNLTVSEIIYAVGFSDPKYFRTVFRERFGVLPAEYNRPGKTGPEA